jgi:hypothetical protein
MHMQAYTGHPRWAAIMQVITLGGEEVRVMLVFAVIAALVNLVSLRTGQWVQNDSARVAAAYQQCAVNTSFRWKRALLQQLHADLVRSNRIVHVTTCYLGH